MEILQHKPKSALNEYKAAVLDKPFTRGDGTVFEKSVRVDFIDNKHVIKESREYGLITGEAVYPLIAKARPVDLSDCYVTSFTLKEYRKRNSIPETQQIRFNHFSAKNSFFDCGPHADFTYAVFSNNRISFENAVFGNGDYNFSHSVFEGGPVSFKGLRLGEGIADFSFAEFSKGTCSFRFSNFGSGDVMFVSAKFGGDTDFHYVTWGEGIADFRFAKFQGNVSFEKSVFGAGKIDFKAVEFLGDRVDFKRVEWGNGDISFEGAEFANARANFRSSVFGTGDISFEETHFGAHEVSFDNSDFYAHKVSFHKAQAQAISFEACRMNCHFDFRFSSCRSLSLKEAVIRDIIDLVPEEELRSPVEVLSFPGLKNLGRIHIDWKRNNVRALIYNQSQTTLAEKAEQFRILKGEFDTDGKYDDEDRAFVEYMRCDSRARLRDQVRINRLNAFWAYPAYGFKWLVFDRMGQYATNPIRVLQSMLLIYICYSLLVYLFIVTGWGEVSTGLPIEQQAGMLWRAFYYCGITFLTVGYGDYFPLGNIQWLAILIGWTGAFMMSYFVVAFVRKILR